MDGSVPAQIATVLGDQISSGISLSPDGTLIFYGFTRFVPALEWSAAVIPARGGPPQETFPLPPENGVCLCWSSDGKALQYLWTRDGVGAKGPRQITHFTTGRISAFSWSADRKRLFLSRSNLCSDAVLLTTVR